MELTQFTWLCSELGLLAVAESDHGVVANHAAVTSGCDPRPASLEAGLRFLLRSSLLPVGLRNALTAARSGVAQAVQLSDNGVGQAACRVLVLPAGPGRAQVGLAPLALGTDLALTQRASMVDVAAAVSHEVANAVGAIAGWAQLAGTPSAGVKPEEALKLIASCARTAQEAARSMLQLARGEQGEEPKDVQLSELADELLTLLSLTARQQRVSLSGCIEPDVCVRGSRSQLFTVLWNLTKNAIEACPPGGSVSVNISADFQTVALTVSDTGSGLSPAELTRVFTPYYSTKSGGTGLGLALVQRAIAELGGEIQVESRKAEGTTFRTTFPRALRASQVGEKVEVPPCAPSNPDHAVAPPCLLDTRVLVVDDDDALREMIATALSLRGAQVVTARNPEEARATEGRFDIALIDMTLQGCRGDELLASLRRRGDVSAAMLVTGTVQKPRLVPGGEPDDWVRKPFELSDLVERIQRTLERHRMLSSVAATSMR